MANPGIAPADPNTNVGATRYLMGDTVSVPLVPTVAGHEDYAYFSDTALGTFLQRGSHNPLMACGFAFMQLAAGAALQSVTVETSGMKADLTKRAADLRSVANSFFEKANNEERLVLSNTGMPTLDVRDLMYPTGSTLLSDIYFTVPAPLPVTKKFDLVFDNGLVEDPDNPGFFLLPSL